MRLEDLQAFALICDAGQLSRAANRLGSTQSALSKTVGRLEIGRASCRERVSFLV